MSDSPQATPLTLLQYRPTRNYQAIGKFSSSRLGHRWNVRNCLCKWWLLDNFFFLIFYLYKITFKMFHIFFSSVVCFANKNLAQHTRELIILNFKCESVNEIFHRKIKNGVVVFITAVRRGKFKTVSILYDKIIGFWSEAYYFAQTHPRTFLIACSPKTMFSRSWTRVGARWAAI